ncbi:unnamed protein product [Amoebophrya sp. A120]|nr:unnamed protein product [Amoebophrya sp. A120]|eukprot:GSA120T00017103001.1
MGRDREDPRYCLRKAEEAAATSIWKWTADHFVAASQYEHAAKGFFAEEDYNKARTCWEKSAYHRENDGDGYGAARAYEEAAKISLDKLGDLDAGLQRMDAALQAYTQRGKEEACCRLGVKKIELLTKAAAPAAHISQAFDEAINIHKRFEKWYPLGELLTKYENFLTLELRREAHKQERVQRVARICEVLDEHIKNQSRVKQGAGPQLLAKVIITLAMTQDVVRVKLFLEETNNWTEDMYRGPNLVELGFQFYDAYDSRDAKKLEKLKQRQTLTMLPLEICKLVQKMQLVGGGKVETGLSDFVDSKGNLRSGNEPKSTSPRSGNEPKSHKHHRGGHISPRSQSSRSMRSGESDGPDLS